MRTASRVYRFSPKLGVSILGIALAALLVACSIPATAISSGLGQPTATSTSAPPSMPFWCDSVWVIEASAWIDSDGDGQQGTDESPLAGVPFDVSGQYSGVSDDAGQKDFHILTGCSSLPTFTVTATPPPGYHLTTPTQVKMEGDGKAAFDFSPE